MTITLLLRVAAFIVLVIVLHQLLNRLVRIAQQARFLRRMAILDRVIRWREILSNDRFDAGTFILNASSLPGKVWWHPASFDESDQRAWSFQDDREALLVVGIDETQVDKIKSHFPQASIASISGGIRM
jgi:hypothetical protein